ncbi:MAG: helix-turn-helix domain-containing protein, partial [Alphaproteobacteria bacterium]|nr:helix-turn-helix domain-containing protein [Alphaproteobacteria bacterium]
MLDIEEVSGVDGKYEPGFGSGASPSHIGATLQRARIAAGYEMRDVAQHLRVRQVYLEAIEDGRHNDLPGRTYAIGFVRTYAEMLKLDSTALVNQFKAETVGLPLRTQLVFPSPPPEGRIPGGAILFVSVLVALVAYGAWYYVSVTEKGLAELVPAVPDRLAALLDRQPATEIAPTSSALEAVASIPRGEEPVLPAPGSAAVVLPAPVPAPMSTAPAQPAAPVAAPLASTPVPTTPSAASAPSAPAETARAEDAAEEDETTPAPSTASGEADPNAALTVARTDAASEPVQPPAQSATQPAAPQPAPTAVASLPAPPAPDAAGNSAGARIVLQARDEV